MFSDLRHVLRAGQFDRPLLDRLCVLTTQIRKIDKTKAGSLFLQSLLRHRRAMLYFTQPSTRTFLSCQSACSILGMPASEIRDPSTSSERKGESIEDSLRTFSSYVDLIIMRSPIKGLCDRIAGLLDSSHRKIPIINAGSGPDEHPTQALLDIYTLERSFRRSGGVEGKTICLVGDLKRGRTIRSLTQLLVHYPGVKIVFSSPKEFRIEEDLREFLRRKGQQFSEVDELKSILPQVDAVYMTRVQDEYDSGGESSRIDTSLFKLAFKDLELLNPNAVILHPLPRRDELDVKIDSDPRARYWHQERNGMWVRVALIALLMGVADSVDEGAEKFGVTL